MAEPGQYDDDPPRPAGRRGVFTPLVSLALLTLFAGVVILPFVYMLFISLKSMSEVASGTFLPSGFKTLITLRVPLAWVEADLTEEQSAAVSTLELVPVLPGPPGALASRVLDSLPREIVQARKVALDKPSIESQNVRLLLELADDNSEMRNTQYATVFYPGTIDGTWQATAGTVVPRTLHSALSRLVANYTSIANWDDLRHGRIFHWLSTGYPRWYFNSLFIAFATVALGVFLDSLAGFAFAKYDFPGRKPLFAILLATIMIPYPVTLVPSFFIFAKLGLYNTFAALIIPGLVSAFGIFLVRQYVQGIPDDMLNAARVDGATDFRIYRHIILPTARPVLAALAVFRFIWQWNSYLYPLVLTNRDSMKTVQLGLATLQDHYGTIDYGVQMAGATLAVLPILGVYAFMQRHFIAGITLGSVKD